MRHNRVKILSFRKNETEFMSYVMEMGISYYGAHLPELVNGMEFTDERFTDIELHIDRLDNRYYLRVKDIYHELNIKAKRDSNGYTPLKEVCSRCFKSAAVDRSNATVSISRQHIYDLNLRGWSVSEGFSEILDRYHDLMAATMLELKEYFTSEEWKIMFNALAYRKSARSSVEVIISGIEQYLLYTDVDDAVIEVLSKKIRSLTYAQTMAVYERISVAPYDDLDRWSDY